MILDQIVNCKKKEIEDKKNRLPCNCLLDNSLVDNNMANDNFLTNNDILSRIAEITDRSELPNICASRKKKVKFGQALKKTGKITLIAEVKKASPSKGVICPDFKPLETAKIYQNKGASAVSVLTDEKFFQGSAKYLSEISSLIDLPVLRKDFIIDQYQIYESYLLGADAILLIASVISKKDLQYFLQTAALLRMECLVEIHNTAELDKAVEAGAKLIGINNRDLNTFQTDLQTTFNLMEKIKGIKELTVVSESGIHSREDVEKLSEAGVDAILVGESLMSSSNVGEKMDQLLGMEKF